MTWLVWRQHRYELLGLALGGILVALALAFGVAFTAATREELGVDRCQPEMVPVQTFFIVVDGRWVQVPATEQQIEAPRFPSDANCVALAVEAGNRVQPFRWLLVTLFFLPALAGAFVGGPLFSREFERGTQRFAWAQGVTRLRWSAAKLGALLLAGLLGAVAVAFAGSPARAINGSGPNAFVNFDIEGPAFVSYVLFAIALCAFVGTMSRRIITGVFVGLLLFGAARLGVMHELRPVFQAPVTVVYGANEVDRWTQFKMPEGAWDFGIDFVDHEGQQVSSARVNQVLRSEPQSPPGGMARDDRKVLAANGIFQRLRYQPAERYELFQWIEATIFLVLSGAFVAGTLLLLRRRDA
jgi:hypothetical protein